MASSSIHKMTAFEIQTGDISTVEPQFNEVPRDCQNLLAKRFHYIEVPILILHFSYWGKENRLLY